MATDPETETLWWLKPPADSHLHFHYGPITYHFHPTFHRMIYGLLPNPEEDHPPMAQNQNRQTLTVPIIASFIQFAEFFFSGPKTGPQKRSFVLDRLKELLGIGAQIAVHNNQRTVGGLGLDQVVGGVFQHTFDTMKANGHLDVEHVAIPGTPAAGASASASAGTSSGSTSAFPVSTTVTTVTP